MEKHTNRNSYNNSEDTSAKAGLEDGIDISANDTNDSVSVIGVTQASEEDTTTVTDAKPELPKTNEKQVKVSCYQLYLRPEPNKKQSSGILTQGTVLTVIEEDEKLPEGWLHVSTGSTEGYVIAEYVESV